MALNAVNFISLDGTTWPDHFFTQTAIRSRVNSYGDASTIYSANFNPGTTAWGMRKSAVAENVYAASFSKDFGVGTSGSYSTPYSAGAIDLTLNGVYSNDASLTLNYNISAEIAIEFYYDSLTITNVHSFFDKIYYNYPKKTGKMVFAICDSTVNPLTIGISDIIAGIYLASSTLSIVNDGVAVATQGSYNGYGGIIEFDTMLYSDDFSSVNLSVNDYHHSLYVGNLATPVVNKKLVFYADGSVTSGTRSGFLVARSFAVAESIPIPDLIWRNYQRTAEVNR
jgi:hypothetical protein